MTFVRCLLGAIIFSTLVSRSSLAANYSELYIPLPGLTARDIAIIVNVEDELSQKIGHYYSQRRGIPSSQIIEVRFKPGLAQISEKDFKRLKSHVDEETPKHVQAFVLTWMLPYRVDCMSITTAFAAGFDKSFCAIGCKSTKENPYYNSFSQKPYDDLQWRPTMALAGENFDQVKKLIDRGITADYTYPQGSGYLLKTTDRARSTRAGRFLTTVNRFKNIWNLQFLEQNSLQNKQDVMFYFTGLANVPHIKSNRFLPGSIADHLTSSGGQLDGKHQMSSIEWLKAGATASYGTVVEPCNLTAKFPNPEVILYFYLRGNSLIEAYWKSVAWPGQGIFIGEPLARPFGIKKPANN
ncbi:MAG: TIGR03790 family protein [Methylococcaceae bacterium]